MKRIVSTKENSSKCKLALNGRVDIEDMGYEGNCSGSLGKYQKRNTLPFKNTTT